MGNNHSTTPIHYNMHLYCVEVFTGQARRASTHGKVSIKLKGELGSTEWIPLTSPTDDKNLFRKNKADMFYVLGENIGKLAQIVIQCEGKFHSWLLEQIMVHTMGFSYRTGFNSWVEDKVTLDLQPIGDKWKSLESGRIALGPILKFRGTEKRIVSDKKIIFWKMSVMMVTTDIDTLTTPIKYFTSVNLEEKVAHPKQYNEMHKLKFWRYEFEIEILDVPQSVKYFIGDSIVHVFEVPSLQEKPRMVFGSCIHRAHPYKLGFISDITATWKYLKKDHQQQKFHLQILGGDQVYADQVFSCSESLRSWDALPKKEKHEAKITQDILSDAKCFYYSIYLFIWNSGEISDVMATLPNVMMWDDHDIFDGWGSLQPELQHCDVLQGLFPIAKSAFYDYQLAGDDYSVLQSRGLTGPFTCAYTMTGDVSLIMLDARTERDMISHTEGVVMSDKSWINVENWLREQKAEHLFVVCTTPVVYPHRNLADKMMDLVDSSNLDDSRDHWPASIHIEETSRLINDLVTFKRQNNASVTLLAGDVHLGATGVIKDSNTKEILMTQFISSGMGSNPPGKAARFMFKNCLKTKFRLKPNYKLQMEKLPDGHMFLPTQNYLTLQPVLGRDRPTYKGTWIGIPKHMTPITEPLLDPILLQKESM